MKLNAKTFSGAVRDRILDHMKTMRKPWPGLSEAEQQAHIDAATKMASDLVDEMIDVITETGAASISASVKTVQVKQDAISATVTIDREDENAQLFINAAHGPCKLAFANRREDLTAIGDSPAPDPDQKPMFEDDKPKSAPMTETGKEPKRRGRPPKGSGSITILSQEGVTTEESPMIA